MLLEQKIELAAPGKLSGVFWCRFMVQSAPVAEVTPLSILNLAYNRSEIW